MMWSSPNEGEEVQHGIYRSANHIPALPKSASGLLLLVELVSGKETMQERIRNGHGSSDECDIIPCSVSIIVQRCSYMAMQAEHSFADCS